MRLLNVAAGVLFTLLGVFCIASSGLSFISLAFPIGVVLLIVGIIECFGYKKTYEAEDEENRHWVLIEGITTFVLGIVVLTGKLAADIAVPVVFGMWCLISGIRGLVIITQVVEKEEKDIDFYWTLVVGLLNLGAGIYTFFNPTMLHLPVLMILGIIFVIQGANVIKIGLDIAYHKPELLKTRDEKIADAEEAAHQAKQEAKKAIKKAKKAKHAVKAAAESNEFHEIIAEPIGETKDKEDKENQ